MKILGIVLVCLALGMLFPQAREWLNGGGWSPDTINDYIPIGYLGSMPTFLQETVRLLFDLPAALIPGLLGLFIVWRGVA